MVKIQCLALRSPNPKKLVDFYEKVFGLTFSFFESSPQNCNGWYVAREEDGGEAILEIHKLNDGETFSPLRFSFKVDSIEELQLIKNTIREYRFPKEFTVPDTSYDESIMLNDLDGNHLFVML